MNVAVQVATEHKLTTRFSTIPDSASYTSRPFGNFYITCLTYKGEFTGELNLFGFSAAQARQIAEALLEGAESLAIEEAAPPRYTPVKI